MEKTIRWKAIRHEWEVAETSFGELAKKYDISVNTIKARRKREEWSREHPQPYDRIAEDNEIARKEAEAHKKLVQARDEAVRKAQALEKDAPIRIIREQAKPLSIEYTREDGSLVEQDLLDYLYDEEDGLTEKQRLFCYHYLTNFNATRAYMKAFGGSYTVAKTNASLLLKRPLVAEKLYKLKQENARALKLDAQDVLKQYIDIANADIGDYVEFGKQVKKIKYPAQEEGGEDTTEEYYVNYVDLNDSSQVNTSLISEIRQGRDGVSIKLYDKMKALDVLAKYTDMYGLLEKQRLEKEKLQAEIARLNRENGDGSQEETVMIISNEEEMRRALAQREEQQEATPTEEV
ncbi:terminase small subunit [Bacillus paranthracis]|uniref:terminase small subunit n=1 Tax=Bacillus paranthracis TaxID=2026186 RepID=UPI003D656CBA